VLVRHDAESHAHKVAYTVPLEVSARSGKTGFGVAVEQLKHVAARVHVVECSGVVEYQAILRRTQQVHSHGAKGVGVSILRHQDSRLPRINQIDRSEIIPCDRFAVDAVEHNADLVLVEHQAWKHI